MDFSVQWNSLCHLLRWTLPYFDRRLQEYVFSRFLVKVFSNVYLECTLGCSDCADSTGVCLTCTSGFTLDSNDKTKCNAQAQTTNSGTTCPDGSFSDGTQCKPCDSACQKCKGGTSNDCTLCASGSYAFNGGCVSAGSNGVCEGSGLIADNNKHICDSESTAQVALRVPYSFFL